MRGSVSEFRGGGRRVQGTSMVQPQCRVTVPSKVQTGTLSVCVSVSNDRMVGFANRYTPLYSYSLCAIDKASFLLCLVFSRRPFHSLVLTDHLTVPNPRCSPLTSRASSWVGATGGFRRGRLGQPLWVASCRGDMGRPHNKISDVTFARLVFYHSSAYHISDIMPLRDTDSGLRAAHCRSEIRDGASAAPTGRLGWGEQRNQSAPLTLYKLYINHNSFIIQFHRHC